MDPRILTVRLPDIGEGVIEGEVIEWLKQVGDHLKQDEPVVVVMTDKATVELPAPCPGILVKQYFNVGEISIKDKPLYDIQINEEVSIKTDDIAPHQVPSPCAKNDPSCHKEKHRYSEELNAAIPPHLMDNHHKTALAIPKVRKQAKDLGIDLHEIAGTGKEGRVTQQDVQKATSRVKASPHQDPPLLHLQGDEELPLIGIRGLMAKKMREGHAVIPQFSYFEQVEATHLVQLRQNFKGKAASEGISLSFMPFFIRALSLTMKQFPLMNSCVDMSSAKIIVHHQHNIGIAMASSKGLIVPVLKGVDNMSLEEIIKAYEALKARAANSKLASEDMKEATITITNFGVLEGAGTWATPMIHYPEVAILGIARIRKEPVVRNDEIVIRDILPLSWSFDHRIIDGELAISISHFYHNLIRDPAMLL